MRWFFKAIWSLLNLILLRLDGIAFTGAEITPYYDSLLGKILLSWKLLALVLFIKFKIISILTFYLKIKYQFFFFVSQGDREGNDVPGRGIQDAPRPHRVQEN